MNRPLAIIFTIVATVGFCVACKVPASPGGIAIGVIVMAAFAGIFLHGAR